LIENKSFLGKNWKISEFDQRKSLMISQRYKLNELTSKILTIRNIKEEDLDFFLNPDIKNHLPDPYILKDMKKSTDKVYQSILQNDKVGIIADYDVDGSTSCALIVKFFQYLNIKIYIETPDRINEGYGPNKRIIDKFIKKNVQLILILDCGTSSHELLRKKNLNSIDTIIIDHHISELTLPDVYGIINPNRFDENNNLKNLSAVGITFLFLVALRRKLRLENYYSNNNIKEQNLTSYLDLVALGTVCDVVSLTNINRLYVKKGLEVISQRINRGITSLIDISKIRNEPDTYDLSFIIGPKLNAASRIGDATLSSKILYSSDLIEIESISKKLNLLNEKRKLIEKKMIEEAKEQALLKLNNKVIIVESYNWHLGVLGIVASKLVDEFKKPAIVISKNDNYGIGSARSIIGIDLGLLIINAKEKGILINGGGHKMAAGLKISNKKIKNFLDFLENNVDLKYLNTNNFATKIDSLITLEEINDNFFENIEIMKPFGQDNPEPNFIIKNLKLDFIKRIKEKHLLLSLSNDFGNTIKGFCFNVSDTNLGENLIKSQHKRIDIITHIKKDQYYKNEPQLIITDAKYS